jgi:hypothetical protein
MKPHRWYTLFALLAALVLAPATSADAAAPPAGKTYFTILLGLDTPYTWRAECLRFTRKKICAIGGPCGTWKRIETGGEASTFSFEMDLEEDGTSVLLFGSVQVEDGGPEGALGGAVRVEGDGETLNFGLTGRSVARRSCLAMASSANSRVHSPSQPAQTPACVERALFGDPSQSRYVLPYPAGHAYHVNQTYCFQRGGHRGQLSYDFRMATGDQVIAARGGVVREVRESSPDNGRGNGEHNYILIEHDDGSVAFYAHMQQNNVAVEPGQTVAQGEHLGHSGNSGLTDGPHLHFGVYRTYPPREGDDLPINFVNGEGPLDERGGLVQGMVYNALGY